MFGVLVVPVIVKLRPISRIYRRTSATRLCGHVLNFGFKVLKSSHLPVQKSTREFEIAGCCYGSVAVSLPETTWVTGERS